MKKRKKNNNLERARRGVRGMIIEWEDPNPLRDTSAHIGGKISHKNPIYRLCVKDVFRDFGDWITTKQPFRWLIEITVVFDYPNGARQNEIRELEAYAVLAEINKYCIDEIKDAMRHGNIDHYTTTLFKIECIDSADKRRKTA